MKEKKIMALADENIMNTYRRVPIALVKGEGARLWDANGKEYLDFVAGIAVCNLGHSHPNVVKAIKKQAKNLMHVSNLYYTRPQGEVASILTKHSFADKVFFCNSGAEANEAAIKLARKYAHENLGEDKFELITMKDSFHGRTMATITATGQEKFQFGFTPLLDGFKYVPFNDPAALEDAIKARIETLRASDSNQNAPIPVDLVTTSGSGLDPHISLAAAAYQVGRVARQRNLSVSEVSSLVARHVEPRQLGLLGEPRVNVLQLNLALDA